MSRAYRSRLALVLCCVAIAAQRLRRACRARRLCRPRWSTRPAIPGLSHARFWGDEAPDDILELRADAYARPPSAWRCRAELFRDGRWSSTWRCPAAPVTARSVLACWPAGPSAATGRVRGGDGRQRRRSDRAVRLPGSRIRSRSCARSGPSTTPRTWRRRKSWRDCSALKSFADSTPLREADRQVCDAAGAGSHRATSIAAAASCWSAPPISMRSGR